MALHPASHKLPKTRTPRERASGHLGKKAFEVLKKRAKV